MTRKKVAAESSKAACCLPPLAPKKDNGKKTSDKMQLPQEGKGSIELKQDSKSPQVHMVISTLFFKSSIQHQLVHKLCQLMHHWTSNFYITCYQLSKLYFFQQSNENKKDEAPAASSAAARINVYTKKPRKISSETEKLEEASLPIDRVCILCSSISSGSFYYFFKAYL